MDAADVEGAEEIKVGNTGRIDSFYICGQRRFSAGRSFFVFFRLLPELSRQRALRKIEGTSLR